jgi:glucokinase
MILAADIGGTSARMATFEVVNGALQVIESHTFVSADFEDIGGVLRAFMPKRQSLLAAACFGIAGPLRHGCVRTPNLPWIVDGSVIAHQLGILEVGLINDLEANAWGIRALGPEDLLTLNVGDPTARGNAGLIAAGTGLGEAGIFLDGESYRPFASEGGHVEFAPRDALEIELAGQLIGEFGHSSYERVLSGPGLTRIYHFLRDTHRAPESALVAAAMRERDPAAVISEFALENRCSLCVSALDFFISVYGAEAGNVALKFMSVSGMYVGGGIAPKIARKLQEGGFMRSFVAKGRMRALLESIPVHVILNPMTALLGAARYASEKAGLFR